MSYSPGDIYYKQIDSYNISGVSVNMDATPNGVLVRNGVDDFSAGARVFVSNVDIGRYNVSGIFPLTYNYNDSVCVSLSGYVGGLFTKAVIDFGNLDKHTNSLNDVAATGVVYVGSVQSPVAVTGTAPNNFIVKNSVSPGVTVSVTGTLPTVTVGSINPGLTVSVTGTVPVVNTVNSIIPGNTISVTGTAPNNFIVKNSVSPGVTVSVTGTLPPVSVSAINPGLTVSVTGVNQWTTTEMSQIRFKLGIDGVTSTPTNQYGSQLELSISGVHNIMVENNVNMNQWMALMGAVVAGSSVVNGNNITYYATNNNSIQRVSATAISGARQAIVLFVP